MRRPGQFVILRVDPHGERVPISLTDFDADKGTVTLVVQQVGKTSRMMCSLEEGDEVLDLAGPLGRPAPLPEGGHAVLVGGGFGAGAALPARARAAGARRYRHLDRRRAHRRARHPPRPPRAGERRVPRVHGRRLARLPRLHGRAPRRGARRRRAVHRRLRGRSGGDDARGRRGDAAARPAHVRLARPDHARRHRHVRRVPHHRRGETKFACVDGPFFDAHQVEFDEAVVRSKMYVDEERIALETAGAA